MNAKMEKEIATLFSALLPVDRSLKRLRRQAEGASQSGDPIAEPLSKAVARMQRSLVQSARPIARLLAS